MGDVPTDTAEILAAHAAGDPDAASRLLPLIYDELRAVAGRYMRQERPDHTLQPTALVHEAYLRLLGNSKINWRGKSQFVALAALQMRRVLVDHARAHRAQKRGADRHKITLDDGLAFGATDTLDMLVFDAALRGLAEKSARQCRVTELRCFAGLTTKEIAYVLEISERTARREWLVARAWLRRALSEQARPRQ